MYNCSIAIKNGILIILIILIIHFLIKNYFLNAKSETFFDLISDGNAGYVDKELNNNDENNDDMNDIEEKKSINDELINDELIKDEDALFSYLNGNEDKTFTEKAAQSSPPVYDHQNIEPNYTPLNRYHDYAPI